MPSPRKTLLVGNGATSDCSSAFKGFYLKSLNCDVEWIDNAVESSRLIKTITFPLIILSCKTAPLPLTPNNLGFEQATDLPELKDLWHGKYFSENDRYFNITLQLAKYARAQNSPNKNSLIIMAGLYDDAGGLSIPNIAQRARSAGIDDYFNMLENEKGFFGLVNERLGWRKNP